MNKNICLCVALQVFLPLQLIAQTSNKVALVIGNGHYKYVETLQNPVNDAKDMAESIRGLGFTVLESLDATRSKMLTSISKFSKLLDNRSIAVLYYSGHGIQRNGISYLVPIDVIPNISNIESDPGINLDNILRRLNRSNPKLSITFLDACRDNPSIYNKFRLDRNTIRDNHDTRNISTAAILAFATEPGQVAVDGYQRNSPYTSALLKYMSVPGITVQEMLIQVGLTVMNATDGEQKPWYSSSPTPTFCFAGCLPLSAITNDTINPNERRLQLIIKKLDIAFRERRIHEISQLVNLNQKQKSLLLELFSNYVQFTHETLIPAQHLHNKFNNKITINILEAVNHQGNRIRPASTWSHISLTLRDKYKTP